MPTTALLTTAMPTPAVSPCLTALRQQHDDLDAAIAALALSGSADDLTITRLKKRKLQLKDEIAALFMIAS